MLVKCSITASYEVSSNVYKKHVKQEVNALKANEKFW